MKHLIMLISIIFLFVSCADKPINAELTLLATSDLHSNLLAYDYYSGKESLDNGLSRVATLIEQNKTPNTILLDNGDTLQGTPLADYFITKKLWENEAHPMILALEKLSFDAINLGNHEFNYGLDVLIKQKEFSKVPFINGNIFNVTNNDYQFPPYLILEKDIVSKDGSHHPLKIGIIGVTPPQITMWDKGHLDGKVKTEDMVASVKKLLPVVYRKGAQMVILLAHTGLGAKDQSGELQENSAFALANITGIDAVVAGHSHGLYPEKQEVIEGDQVAPVVLPGFWGSHLGKVVFNLELNENEWHIKKTTSEVLPVKIDKEKSVDEHPEIVKLAEKIHKETLEFLNTPIGETTVPLNTFFALVEDNYAVELIARAQIWFATEQFKNTPYKDMPLLAAAAPFKAGGRDQYADSFTEISKGPITLKNVADLYIYPNTLKVVKVTGKDLREWLEVSASRFNQMKPGIKEQPLQDNQFRPYNFDMIEGITYEIDLSKPARYNKDGQIVSQEYRIPQIKYLGKVITDSMEFLVATNNYRANGGGNFPFLNGQQVIFDSPETNRDILAEYLKATKKISGAADQNWKFKKLGFGVSATFEAPERSKSFAKYPVLRTDSVSKATTYQIKL